MSDVTDRCGFVVSPRSCVHCGHVMTGAPAVDSTDQSTSDTDCDRIDEPATDPTRFVVSERSLISSRSSTPRDGHLQAPPAQLPPPPPPPPHSASDDECTSLLSSSDDLDSEYGSAIEAPETQLNDVDDADVFSDRPIGEFQVSSLDEHDDEEDDDLDEGKRNFSWNT